MFQFMLKKSAAVVITIHLFFILSGTIAFGEKKDLRTYKRTEILKITEKLEPHFQFMQERMAKPSDADTIIDSYNEDFQAIEALSQYPVFETMMTIWGRLKYEIFHISLIHQDAELKDRAIKALRSMASINDQQFFEEIDTALHVLSRAKFKVSSDQMSNQRNMDRLETLKTALALYPDQPPLPSLDELLGSSRMGREAALRHLKEFTEILQRKIIGQPEVIEALESLEWERQFMGVQKETPDIIYLMGSPGTGKDTAAEAFADALHGEDKAYEKHLFRLPIMRERPDLWQVLGSSTGYIGSESFPPFLKFLVEHSGGKYKLEKAEKGFKIVDNPDWKGFSLPNSAPPESGVVFINEFHNWSKEIKDVFVKQALEKGIFTINNPNGGLSQIQVPIRFVVASNEGISLVTSRESNGERYGKSLSYEEMLMKWEKAQADKRLLKAEIMAGNGPARNSVGKAEGISEELLNRIPDRFLILMRPLSPEGLKEIAEIELRKLAESFSKASSLNPGMNIQWDDELVSLIQSYDYSPEDNGRPISAKIKSLIKEPLIQFFKSDQLDSENALSLDVSVVSKPDGTRALKIEAYAENGSEVGVFEQPIKSTVKDKAVLPIEDAQIERLSSLPEVIKSRVFGVDQIADRISERVLSLANQTSKTSKAPRSASTLVLMGLSSTGKTELSKAITEALSGDEKSALVIDFSQVQNLHDFKTRVLGTRDAYGNPIPSDFMKHYDRSDGDIVVVFDELSNVRDQDLLKSLYDFFREPVLSTFSDGKERVMSRVKVIVTGNSGIELYKNVPRDVPMEQQMMAWEEISKKLIKDRETQRLVLERSFPEPLITRWGANNIFFVPPHNYKSLKQLTQLKLRLMIEKIKAGDGRRGWNLGFAGPEDYEAFVHAIIEKAFNLREQGASIDSYIKDDILAPLEAKLLKNKVPSDTRILIKKITKDDETAFGIYSDVSDFSSVLDLPETEDPEHVSMQAKKSENSQILTAYHEVGHALASKLLFRGQLEPTLVSIVPGVAKIGGQWIAYAGIAESELEVSANVTREWAIRRIAVLAAGETAERLVTKSEIHSAGKQNDMERATHIAEQAILKLGLSETWGTESVPPGIRLNDYVARFSEEKKKLFEAEVRKLLNEGRALARELLVKNFEEVVVPMSKELAKKGILKKEEMAPFFNEAKMVDVSEMEHPGWIFSAQNWLRKTVSHIYGRSDKRDGVLKSDDLRPEAVADIEDIIEKRKQDLFAEVAVPESVPFFDVAEFKAAPQETCAELLK